MRAVVVYESMFGNTHLVADAIGRGLQAAGEVVVVPVGEADRETLLGADLLVVGGPTHADGLTRPGTRASAAETAARREDLDLDADPGGDGLREWFEAMPDLGTAAAAFDTRVKGPGWLTGRASVGIAKRLRRAGCSLVGEPRSFLVGADNHLLDEEEESARRFGTELAAALVTVAG